jgi:outer membrane protein W
MKKLFILFLLCSAFASTTQAQDYKKFRVGLGLGYAASGGSGSSGGVLVALEPSYRLSDALSLGLRLETAALTRGFSQDISSGSSVGVAAIGSYTVNGQYYFGSSSFRPFVGLGLGLYSLASVSVSYQGTSVDAVASESKVGFYPRAGFDYGHFNLTLDYNVIGSSDVTSISGSSLSVTNSYFGARIGVYFGGGKK